MGLGWRATTVAGLVCRPSRLACWATAIASGPHERQQTTSCIPMHDDSRADRRGRAGIAAHSMHRVVDRSASHTQLNTLAPKTDSEESVGYCFDSGLGLPSCSRGLSGFCSLADL